MPADAWALYGAWSEAIADGVFSPVNGGRPVYLDLDDDVLIPLWERTGHSGASPTDSLASTVRSTLDLGPRGDVFWMHRTRLTRWELAGRETYPPVLPLLAALSLAAESMEPGEGMASNNYYGRLAQFLRISDPGTRRRLESGYRDLAERMWNSLNDWLEQQAGIRGLPTAYSIGGYRHVGLPLSQALIRAADRRNLRRLFKAVGLTPGESIGNEEMLEILDEWMTEPASSAGSNLRRLWQRRDDTLRSHITDIAAMELLAWSDATDAEQAPSAAGLESSRLNAVLQTFLNRKLDLGLEFHAASAVDRILLLSEAASQGYPSGAFPVSSNWYRLSEAVEAGSLLGSHITIATDRREPIAQHSPRAVYVLAKDNATGIYLERERVVLGLDLLILAADRLRNDVVAVLDPTARPGYQVFGANDLAGVPAGWSLFSNVQVMAAPYDAGDGRFSTDLSVLLPVAVSQIAVGGGLAIPGLISRWSALAPPEVRATTDRAGAFSVSVKCLRRLDGGDAPSEVLETAPDGGVLIVSLAGKGLPDGDYEVVAGQGAHVSGRRTIRLRSADAVGLDGQHSMPLAHYRSTDLSWPIRSRDIDARLTPTVQGGRVDGGTELSLRIRERPVPTWRQGESTARRHRERQSISLGITAACLSSGAHYVDVEEAAPGRSHAGTVSGRCRNCGLVKRYPATWGRLRASSTEQARQSWERAVASLPPLPALPAIAVTQSNDSAAVSAELDAVFYLGGGRMSELEHIASQIEASRLFETRFVKALEDLGHIEVSRDDRMVPTTWSATRPVLVELSEQRGFLLIGSTGSSLLGRLSSQVAQLGGALGVDTDELGLPRRVALGIDRDSARELCRLTEVPNEPRLDLSLDASARLTSLLPALSSVIDAVPPTRIPAHRRSEIFDVATATWRPVDRVDGLGGYRFEGYGVTYAVRRAIDPPDSIAIVDARLVRYASALLVGEPLLAYFPDGLLEAPLGADLPGLYARAAIFASGWLPARTRGGRSLAYRGVSAATASTLIRMLES